LSDAELEQKLMETLIERGLSEEAARVFGSAEALPLGDRRDGVMQHSASQHTIFVET